MPFVRNLVVASLLVAGGSALAGDAWAGKPAAPAPSSSAPAAPPPSTSGTSVGEEVDATARQLFADADAAYARGEYEKAYAMLLAAWNVKKRWSIAASLGAAEMKLGKYVDAANHFAYYEREAPQDRKEKARALLAEATAKVGTLVVSVEPSDAEIVVDAAIVAVPPGSTIYVEAERKHKVGARKGGDAVEVEVLAPAGKIHNVSLVISKGGARSQIPAYVMGGVSVASLIAGAVLLGVGQATASDLEANPPRNANGNLSCWSTPAAGSPTLPECDAWRDKAREAGTMSNFGIGMFVVAGVAAAGALSWWLWPSGARATSAQSWHVVPVAGQRGGGAIIRGTF